MEFGGSRLSILIYHRVLRESDPLQPDLPTAAQFERHMRWLGRFFNVLPLGDAIRRLRDGMLPPRAAAITFDDGYADNYDVVLPILRKLGLHATFFVATGFLDGGRMWNDTVIETVRRWPDDTLSFEPLGIQGLPTANVDGKCKAIDVLLEALKHRPFGERAELVEAFVRFGDHLLPSLMMTTDQIRGLHQAGMTIGGHTRWHPILSVLNDNDAFAEMRNGKEDLQDILHAPVQLFAYPNGKPCQDYTARHVRMAEQLGFTAAVTTAWGSAHAVSGVYELPRFTPWDRTTPRFLARLAQYRVKGQETRITSA